MKKLFIISMLIGAMPLAMLAQDDDLYFVPKKASKTSKVEKVTDDYGLPKDTYYSGSDRTVDDYNRRVKSSYEFVDGDTSKVDIIQIDSVRGVYPDSIDNEDFALTKKMSRFEDYDLSERAAFWAGYERGRYDWGWHSPWYYRTYGWFGGWYDPWYYRSWYGWYDPWYYSSWYYGNWYGWGSPYYWSWNYPYYYGGGGGGRHYYGHTGNAGTINMNGSTHSNYRANRGPIAGNNQRNTSLRDRAARMGGGQTYSSGNSTRSNSGNFGGYRGRSSSNSSRGSYSGSRSSSNSSYSGGSYSSGGGSFSGGGSHSSGGGGRSGGGSLGGRR